MKNKNRIIQIFLILAIFGVIITYFVSASSNSFSFNVSGDYVTSEDDVDSIDISAFKEKNVVGINYELLKGGDKINSSYYLQYEFQDMNGKALDIDKYSYIQHSYSGYFNTQVNVYIDIPRYLEFCKTENNIDILNEFKIQFYTQQTIGDEIVDENNRNIIETRTIRLCDANGNLCDSSINADIATIKNFYLEPLTYEGTFASEIKFDSIDETNQEYYASLNISMGSLEKIKNLSFDAQIISNEFPSRNLLVNGSNAVKIEKISGDNVDVFYNNYIINPTTGKSVTIRDNKFLTIEAFRNNDDSNAIDNSSKYKITFNTFNSNQKVTLYLTINLKANSYTGTSKLVTYSINRDISNSEYRAISNEDGTLDINTKNTFTPYKVVLVNENDEIVYSEENTFIDYVTNESSSSSLKIELSKKLATGFYTLRTYGYMSSIQYDEDRNLIVPDDSSLTMVTSDTFYIDNATYDLGYIVDGKNNAINNKECTIDFYTNDTYGYSAIRFYGNFKNSLGQLLTNDVDITIVNNLVDMKNINATYTINNGLLKIRGDIKDESFYVLVFPKNNSSYIAIKVNVNHISYKQYDLSFISNSAEIEIPTIEGDDKLNIYPKLLVNGLPEDISKYNYDYKILNFDETECTSLNVYTTKSEDGTADYFHYNDASEGNYIVRCYLVDFPQVFADTEIVIKYNKDKNNSKYTLKIVNDVLDVAVPDTQGKENRIQLKSEIYRDDVLTTIVPDYSVVGDTHVSIRNGYLIIKKGATIGNKVIVTATYTTNEGDKLTDSKTFTLVKQTDSNSGNIVDEDDPNGPGPTPGGDSGNTSDDYIVPTTIELLGYETDATLGDYIQLSKSTGDKFVLEYICYDEKGRTISKPSISIDVSWDDASGTTVIKDYTNKEIEVTSNGIYSDRTLTISFKGNDKEILTKSIRVFRPNNYFCTLNFVQNTFTRGGKVEARATFTNNSILESNVLLAVICYDENDKIVTSNITPVKIAASSEYSTKDKAGNVIDYFSAKITLPYDLDNIKVKAFLLDGTTLDDAKGYFSVPITMTNRGGI